MKRYTLAAPVADAAHTFVRYAEADTLVEIIEKRERAAMLTEIFERLDPIQAYAAVAAGTRPITATEVRSRLEEFRKPAPFAYRLESTPDLQDGTVERSEGVAVVPGSIELTEAERELINKPPTVRVENPLDLILRAGSSGGKYEAREVARDGEAGE